VTIVLMTVRLMRMSITAMFLVLKIVMIVIIVRNARIDGMLRIVSIEIFVRLVRMIVRMIVRMTFMM